MKSQLPWIQALEIIAKGDPISVGLDEITEIAESGLNRYQEWLNENGRVLTEVILERQKQVEKWGQQNHHPFHYLAILMEEVGEASQAAVQATGEPGKATWDDYREELVQVAAVALAMIGSFDRNQNAHTS